MLWVNIGLEVTLTNRQWMLLRKPFVSSRKCESHVLFVNALQNSCHGTYNFILSLIYVPDTIMI